MPAPAQLTAARGRHAYLFDLSQQLANLAEWMRTLLEQHVGRLAEHPVIVFARLELGQRQVVHRDHMLDAAQLAGSHIGQEPLEGGMKNGIVIHAQVQVLPLGQLDQFFTLPSRQRHRLFHEHVQPGLQCLCA